MEILVKDKDFISFNIIDKFYSLIWTERYNQCGDFELEIPASIEYLNIFKENYYVELVGDQTSYMTMIIETIKIKTDVENGDTLIVSGRSLESILERRIVWNQTILNGNLQTKIEQLLNDSIINPEDSLRRISNFVFEYSDDSNITSLTIKTQYTGDNLYDVICDICLSYDLGFKIILNDNNQFVFSLYKGIDRSYGQDTNSYVIFSPSYNNLMNTNYLQSGKLVKTIALVLGEGQGTNRKRTSTYSKEGTESGLDRRELYVDARDLSTTNGESTISNSEYLEQLQQRGKEKLSEYEYEKIIDGEAETSIMFKYGIDFNMGDILQVSNEYGIETRVRVLEYIRSQSEDGYNVYPTFSSIE